MHEVCYRVIFWINQAFNGLLGPLMSTLVVFWLNKGYCLQKKMVAALVVPKMIELDRRHPTSLNQTLWIQPYLLRKYLGVDLGCFLDLLRRCLDHFGSIKPKITAATPFSAATYWSHGDKYQRTGRSYHDKAAVTDIGVNDQPRILV